MKNLQCKDLIFMGIFPQAAADNEKLLSRISLLKTVLAVTCYGKLIEPSGISLVKSATTSHSSSISAFVSWFENKSVSSLVICK